MNNSARRDGTPDRRKRSDQPRSGANRTAAPRGGSARTGQAGSRGEASGRRGTSAGGFQRSDDTGRRGTSTGGYQRDGESAGRRGGSAGGYQPRGGSAGGQRDGAPARRGSAGGYQREGAPTGRRDGSGGGYPRDDAERGGYPRGAGAGQRGGAPRAGATARPATTQAPAARKKTAKPQRKVVAPTILNNAKPARHQHADATEGPKKLPWGEGERLQKVLAKAGVASRRAAEDMIAAGRVEVDGKIVREQGLRVDPENAVVRVDGTRVVVRDELVHLVLNKPKGWQSTMSDDLGRPCVGDIVAERIAAGQRLFHVGRLDADTEGLLLLTNDGEMAHRLMHPSFEVPKTYLATVHGEVNYRLVAKRFREGVELEDGPAKVDKFTMLEAYEGRSLVKLVLHEGRKHIVRRLLDEVGHPVIRLVRTHLGPVALGDQRPGTLRVLGRDEIGKLYEAVQL
ncbi:pseudouridine synthase [Nocardia mangyaensis]|uniref:pseudouridine synthase n=1 Tax=Nocardia mangyaensis TaxID=2213200 RepID=UPI000A053DE7|nr:pseudouridine synthase [Nocardia mangyaensis]